jgi:hypothetical protein
MAASQVARVPSGVLQLSARSRGCARERAPTAPGLGYGRFHFWLELPVQSQICSWVPEPP